MDNDVGDILYFEACSGLDGTQQPVQIGRRNGRRSPLFHPDWTSAVFPPKSSAKRDRKLPDAIFINLTALERQTWLQIVRGSTIAEIARAEGVSRTAIYTRIRGKDGHGGMAARNAYVGVWWELRQQRTKR
jgi:hypothetical protein